MLWITSPAPPHLSAKSFLLRRQSALPEINFNYYNLSFEVQRVSFRKANFAIICVKPKKGSLIKREKVFKLL